jgi:hypothetical protein
MTPKNPAAVALGRKGGAAKHPRKGFGSMTPERRAEIAAKAVEAKRAKKSVAILRQILADTIAEHAPTAAAPTPGKPPATA